MIFSVNKQTRVEAALVNNSLLKLLSIIRLLWSRSAKKTGSPRPPP